jgi:hypothetical protein
MSAQTLPASRTLRLGVVASMLAVVASFLDEFTTVGMTLLGYWFMPIVIGAAGLIGAFCGGVALFRATGFHRIVAALCVTSSLYALIRIASEFGRAINLP